jgi:hypothetical protein
MNYKEIMTLADDFVNKFYAGDIQVVTPPEDMKAVGDPTKDMARNMAHSLIRSQLGDAINMHVRAKSFDSACKLVKLMTSARNQGMIVENESHVSKSKRLEQENGQLKEENLGLQKQIAKLTKLNKELETLVKSLTPIKKGENSER